MMSSEDALKWAVNAFKDDRNARYDFYANYIAGKQPLEYGSERMKNNAFGRTFGGFSYNRCLMVRDAHADRLQVQGFGADDEALSQDAQDMWDVNSMDRREGHLEQDAFGLGDGYLIVELHPRRGNTQVWVQDPRLIRVHYSDEIPDEKDMAAKMWEDADTERTRLNIYFYDRIEKYITRTKTQGSVPDSPGAFERYQPEGDVWPMPLEVKDTVPVFHVANNGRTNEYGESEIAGVIPLQDAINYTAYCMFVGMEFSAFSQRVFIGVQVAETDKEKKKFEQIEAGITRAIALEDPDSSVAEFSATDMGQYTKVLEFLDMAVARVTKVPPRYLGMPEPAQSGISKRIDHSPFTAKLEDRARAIGDVFASAVSYGLRLQGREVMPGELRVNWAPLAPVTEGDMWELIEVKVRAGMPFPATLREAGYEPKQIETIMHEREMERLQAQRWLDRGALNPGFGAEEETA